MNIDSLSVVILVVSSAGLGGCPWLILVVLRTARRNSGTVIGRDLGGTTNRPSFANRPSQLGHEDVRGLGLPTVVGKLLGLLASVMTY